MDSLSVYRSIDIASAKPAKAERDGLDYFGLDIVDPSDRFGADEFAKEFLRAKTFCEANDRDLIIVGGSSFYLKALIGGLSPIPKISPQIKAKVTTIIENISAAFYELKTIDPIYAKKIAANDRYRIEKALLIAYSSGEPPTVWFAKNPPKPILTGAKIALVTTPIEILRERIALRARKMIENGLIEEVKNLLKNTPRSAQSMRAIGIKETIDYIDEKISIKELENLINIHTAQFAKRQRTFNDGQFCDLTRASIEDVEAFGINYLRY
jgi:tRNA dimethylallyltransferase